MKKKRFSVEQIVEVLIQAELRVPISRTFLECVLTSSC